jgi:hypothetical protein
MKTKCTAALVAALALAIPASASAGIMDKYDAADQVERVAGHRYHIDPLVTCRQIGSRSFTCSITDFDKNDCMWSGRANVRKVNQYTFKVTSMRASKDCI